MRERERPVTARAGGRIDVPWESYMVASREVDFVGVGTGREPAETGLEVRIR